MTDQRRRVGVLAAGAATVALVATPLAALADNHAGTTYKFGGYVKFDSMFTDYSDGTPDGNSLMRQFYYAPQIPVVGEFAGSTDMTTDLQARESRLHDRFMYRRDEKAHWVVERLAP